MQSVTHVTLAIEANLKKGEHLRAVGNIAAMGNWKLDKCLALVPKDGAGSSVFTATVEVPTHSRVEYKYVVVSHLEITDSEIDVNDEEADTLSPPEKKVTFSDGGLTAPIGIKKSTSMTKIVRIEGFKSRGSNNYTKVEETGNREFVAQGMEMFINDGLFGQKMNSDPKSVWVGHGWLDENQAQLRLNLFPDKELVYLNKKFTAHWPYATPNMLRVYDPRGLFTDFPLPITTYQSIVLHAPSIEEMHFKLEVLHVDGQKSEVLGTGCVLPSQVKAAPKGVFNSTLYAHNVYNNNNKISAVGECKIEYLVVTPFVHHMNNLGALLNSFLESVNLPIGHRGCGKNKGFEKTLITENTILSFICAAKFGANVIEFDVQLTADNVPVVYHDFEILVNKELEVYENISRLSLKQFLSLKPPRNVIEKTKNITRKMRKSRSSGDITETLDEETIARLEIKKNLGQSPTIKPQSPIEPNPNDNSISSEKPAHSKDLGRTTAVGKSITTSSNNDEIANGHASFYKRTENSKSPQQQEVVFDTTIHERYASLRDTFSLLPPDVGFLIEIKYPILEEQRRRHFLAHERNFLVDQVLKDVFDCAGERAVMFLTFDPDIAVVLRAKQFKYPVLFLTFAGADEFSTYDPDVNRFDWRCSSIQSAVLFAKTDNLDGIVCDSSVILKNQDLVSMIKNEGLLLFTYGSANADPNTVRLQKSLGINGVISDNMASVCKQLRKHV